MVSVLRDKYFPSAVRVIAGPDLPKLELPLMEGRGDWPETAVAYVCHRGVCELPSTTPHELFARFTPKHLS